MDQDLEKEPGEESTVLIWLTGIVFFAAIAAIFIFVPTEKTEGPIQRIMYFKPIILTEMKTMLQNRAKNTKLNQ